MFRYSDPNATPFEPSLPSPNCTLIAPLLTAYFDLEASGAEATRVQQHLSACARCAQMWRDWGDTRLLLRTMPTPAPPYTLAAEIVQTSRLVALLPAAPLTSEFGIASQHDETVVPPQLHNVILAATTRAPIAMTEAIRNDTVVMERDFSRSLRGAKPLVAMALVPTLALWLITLTANNTTFFASAPQTSAPAPSALSSAPAMSRVSKLKDMDLVIASTKSVTEQPLEALPQKPVLPRAAEASATTLAAASVDAADAASQSSEPASSPVTLARWSPSTTAVSSNLAAPMSAYTVRPLAATPLPIAAPLRPAAGKSVKVAAPSSNHRSVRTVMLPQTPRRSAKLSTVSMTNAATLASSMPMSSANLSDETVRGDNARMAMKLDAPAVQKATMPVAASRETHDESLWQSDVATGGSALSVVQALNDNRPRELRDAFDAYAKTLIDDSDGAATL